MVETETKIQRYERYKDSGVGWLGEIPEHWECIRMKHLYKDVSIKNRPNELLSSVTQDRGVIPRDWIESRMVMPSGNLDSFKFIEKEDFAISLRSFEGGLEFCYHNGIISPAYTVLKRKKENLYPTFYKYLFKSISFISELQTSVVGIREGKNISYSELSYSSLPIPPLPEQTAIAQFLDDKTTKIDQGIAIKEEQINLLKERKQILIHKAVTRGLDDKVKLKDSGVEWIGEIPEHWEVCNFRYLIRVLTDYTANGSFGDLARYVTYLNEPSYSRLIRLTDLRKNLKKSGVYLDEKSHKYLNKSELYGGELLMANVGAYAGLAWIMPEIDSPASLAPNMFLIKPFENKIKIQFLFNLINSNAYSKYISIVAQSAAQPKLNKDNIRQLKIILPSIKEQKEISAYIETISQKIETAIGLKQQEIDKLKEYKSSLINGVVTGKVRVC
ncbi:restriction endonuclease subunit S [Yeosuana marina]|uniref:restriction endonuclease subunit S n=1 Tax=Yeosuana marina TaxID=1565536 RepID=UPI0030EF7AC5|tara:strand:- start:3450 stop:4781 length:1332 start_codon:yes stop_codon:yes gene_type:complete